MQEIIDEFERKARLITGKYLSELDAYRNKDGTFYGLGRHIEKYSEQIKDLNKELTEYSNSVITQYNQEGLRSAIFNKGKEIIIEYMSMAKPGN